LALGLCVAAAAGGCGPPTAEQILRPSYGRWRRTGPIVHFTADNLYDHIDGEADFVVRFGFRSLAQGTYRRGAEVQSTVDVYDMGSADNAFALFRSRADVEARALDVGTEGAGDEARVEFWQGRFYVDLSIWSPEAGASVLALARELARALPPTKAWPAYLKLLPQRGRVARSEQYLPTDFLGHEFLRRAVTARYKLGGRQAVLFACRYDKPADAAAALARFQAVVRPKGALAPLAVGEGGFVADEPTLGRVAVFRRGRFLGGMTRYAGGPLTDALLADLDRRLRER
jgi:hypothetical protein